MLKNHTTIGKRKNMPQLKTSVGCFVFCCIKKQNTTKYNKINIGNMVCFMKAYCENSQFFM